ncbi:MAG: guanylate kinase [Patescibacteria group bacterium]
MKQPPIILLTGASGAGKSTVLDTLLKEKKLPIVRFVTNTTRAKRSGEAHGKDYWFLDKKEFQAQIKKDAFYEWAHVYDNYYGSAKTEMDRLLKGKKAVVMILDVQGTRTIKRHHPEAIAVFIDAPTASLRHRLKERGTDITDLKRRLAEIAKEKLYKTKADLVIVNKDGDLKHTVSQVKKLIRQAISDS